MKRERFVTPKTYFFGYPELNESEVRRYLADTQNEDFLKSMTAAREAGLSSAEILCSIFAKLCYKALTLGQNANVTRTRDIADNLANCFDTGHGSIFEHVMFNFVVSDCSRVFTHELVRHRVGVAFSQTSGRYCRLDHIPIIWDPILDPVKDMWDHHLQKTEDLVYLTECALGLRVPTQEQEERAYAPDYWVNCRAHAAPGCEDDSKWVPNDKMPFAQKKKLTSAIRRIAPNGQANEIAVSLNLRALRHTILMRTNRVAEWEIRLVFNQIYQMLKPHYPTIFHGAKETMVEGLLEISGMKCQPYEKAADMVLDEMSDDELTLYIRTRPKTWNKIAAEGQFVDGVI